MPNSWRAAYGAPGTSITAVAAGFLLLLGGLLLWTTAGDADRWLYDLLRLPPELAWRRELAVFTELGGGRVMIPLAALGCLWLALRGRRQRAVWLFLTIATGRIIIELAKSVFARPRPPALDQLVAVRTHSFPSSHAAGAMMTGLALSLAFGAGRTGQFAAIAFAVAIGFSRVALGVHWPSDVLAGWGFGFAWAAFCGRDLPRPGFGIPSPRRR